MSFPRLPIPRFAKPAKSAPVPLLGRGWVQPFWLERQADPASSAYVVGGADPSNITGRNWTLLGSVGEATLGAVDPRGLVVTRPNSWSIDWWIRSEQRWHFPSREMAVRQRLVEETPVVVTAMRIPGGDIEHRSYAVSGALPSIVIEIENLTPTPVAVSIAVRPYGLTGQASLRSIELEGRSVFVNGELAVVLPRDPGQVVADYLQADILEMLDLSDCLIVNEHEFRAIQINSNLSANAIYSSVNEVVVTHGAGDVQIRHRDKKIVVAAIKGVSVLDVTGCGDAFRAGYAYGILKNMSFKSRAEYGCVMAMLNLQTRHTQNYRTSLEKVLLLKDKHYGE